jgi:hypothetical protein
MLKIICGKEFKKKKLFSKRVSNFFLAVSRDDQMK